MHLPNVAAIVLCRVASEDGPLGEPDFLRVVWFAPRDQVPHTLVIGTVIEYDTAEHTVAIEFLSPDGRRLWRKERIEPAGSENVTLIASEGIPGSLCSGPGVYLARVLIDGEIAGHASFRVV